MRLACGLLLSTFLVSGAHAADYLRGTVSQPTYSQQRQSNASYDWSGFYVGASGTYSGGTLDMGGIGRSFAATAFTGMPASDQAANLATINPKGSARGIGVAAFVGYNVMFDDVVLGVEAEYNRTSIERGYTIAPASANLSSGDTNYFDTSINGGSLKTKMTDYGVLRGRVGAAYDRWLPYFTVGLVYGNLSTKGAMSGSYTRYQRDPIMGVVDGNTVIIGYTGYYQVGPTRNVSNSSKTTSMSWGYALGAGLDYAMTDSIFLRGKYEYISMGGNNSHQLGMHTVRAGIGTKF